MKKINLIFVLIFLPQSLCNVYEESIGDMLIQCNSHQSEVFADNRTAHLCEKDNFSEDYSYIISLMETRYSKKKFLCFVFLKDEIFKLKFKFWFSHSKFTVDAVSTHLSSSIDTCFYCGKFFSTVLSTINLLATNGSRA